MTLSIVGTYNTGSHTFGDNVQSSALVNLINIPLNKKYFVAWESWITNGSTTRLGVASIEIDGIERSQFTVAHRRPTAEYAGGMFVGQGVFDIDTVNYISLFGEGIGSGGNYTLYITKISAIELSQFIENTDYFYAEDNTAKVDMDNTWTNNLGPSITFTPDGVSNYAVFAFGVIENPSGNTKGSWGGMRVRDVTSGVTISEMQRDVYSAFADPDIAHPLHGMWILEAPAAVPKTIRAEFIGASIWDHRYSNLFIIRVDAFNNNAYVQGTPGTVFSDTITHVIDSYTMVGNAYANFIRMEVGAQDSTHQWGPILYKSNFPTATITSNEYSGYAPYTDPPAPGVVPDAQLTHRGAFPFSGNFSVRFRSQDAVNSTIFRYAALSLGNTSYLEYEPPGVSNQDPAPGETDVGINSTIKFRLASTVAGGVDVATIDVSVDTGSGFVAAILGGIFQPGFSGPASGLAPIGDGSGYDVTIAPEADFPTSQLIAVRIDAENDAHNVPMVQVNYTFTTSIYAFTYSFTPQAYQFIVPALYTEEIDFSSLPSGYSPQSSGTGTAPTYDGWGLTSHPGAAGTSYIKKSAAGLDFEAGVLFDVVIGVPPTYPIPTGKVKVLRLSKADQGSVSVYVDFNAEEIWIGDTVNQIQTGFRPGTKGKANMFFRLSVKGTGENLVARLYSALEVYFDPPLLKQSGGPSLQIPISIDTIEFGSIESGNDSILVRSAKILLGSDPDTFYPFPQIEDISPKYDVLSGGSTLKIQLASEIDIDGGSPQLYTDDEFVDESTGAGSSLVKFGNISLSLAGIGRAGIKCLRSFSGDTPSGADISSSIEVDQSIILKPPQTDILLAGVELSANGNTIAVELVSGVLLGTYFRVRSKSGSVLTLDKKVLNTQKNQFVIRFIRGEGQIKALIDGTLVISTTLKDGPGILRYYAETNEDKTFETKVTDITVRPVIMIGNSIVNV